MCKHEVLLSILDLSILDALYYYKITEKNDYISLKIINSIRFPSESLYEKPPHIYISYIYYNYNIITIYYNNYI